MTQDAESLTGLRDYRAILDHLEAIVYTKDSNGRYTYVNHRVCRLFRRPQHDILGKTDHDLFPASFADILRQNDLQVSRSERTFAGEEMLPVPPNGEIRHYWSIKQPLLDAQDNLIGLSGVSTDITELKKKEYDLRALKNHYSAALKAMPDLMFELDLEGRYHDFHSPRQELLAVPPHELFGKTVYDVLPEEVADICIASLHEALEKGHSSGRQFQLDVPDGHNWFELSVAPKTTPPGEIPRFIVLSRDISDRKQAEEQIRNLAFFDSLTGLPNRRLMFDRLEHALTACARRLRQGALLLIDLDNFKQLNDTTGHEAGDRLLKEVAQRLKTSIRHSDTAARLGGDEFVVILEDIDPSEAGIAQAEQVAHQIQNRLNRPYLLDIPAEGHQLNYHCSCSIGIALFQDCTSSGEELLRRADTAMYQAKAAGRNCLRFFDPHMQALVAARAALEADLRSALDQQQFLLYYQPQVDHNGKITGAEALLRWQHPVRGMVSPADFIPLTEETGLIIPLGLWVLETACLQLAQWAGNATTAGLTLAVNVSARQFHLPGFIHTLEGLLERTGTPRNRLKLELTESLLLDHSDAVIQRMQGLQALGVGFALDDFGTGYSSLVYLKRLPLDQLKIDRSFVRDILANPNDAAIARTIVALGDSLGLDVIAEGVETEAQRELLAANGCRHYQGYLFGRPVPVAQFETHLAGTETACLNT